MPKKIAPKELIRQDFDNLKATERLLTAPKIEEIILMQSMEGRAHNGAGSFNKRFYVNTTIDDIVRALGRNPKNIKNKRQELIDEIRDFVDSAIADDPRERLLTKNGKPILGIPFFRTRQVYYHDILKGLYLGGLRDSQEIRKKTHDLFGINIGYGKCYLVDTTVMDDMGLDGEVLAHQSHEDKIGRYEAEGLIIDEDARHVDSRGVKYMYIRHRVGPGESDDAAIVASGLLYNVDVALGVFLADAVDTLEKYVSRYSDQDQDLARYIESNYEFLGLEKRDVCELAYLSAIPENRLDEIPDSSLRYLLTQDPETGQSTLETHINFIEGRPFAPIVVSYKKIFVGILYDFVKEKLRRLNKEMTFKIPEAFVEKLDESVMEVVQRRFITVGPRTSLKAALKKAEETKSETIIVRDDEGNVLGLVNPADFLVFLRGR
jgi:CBS domain-containing protein